MKLKSILFSATLLLFGATSQAQKYLPQVVLDASQYLIRGCEVKLNVGGWANQLYVNGTFSGNYRDGQEDYELSSTIQRYLQRGVCNYKSRYEVSLLRDPNLVNDFANYRYQNCYVKLYVAGWANQIYIRDKFSGNFKAGEEDAKFRSALVGYIMNGICVPTMNPYPTPYPPYPIPMPQSCTCTLANPWGNFRAVGPDCDSATRAVLNSCSMSNRQAVCSASQVHCY